GGPVSDQPVHVPRRQVVTPKPAPAEESEPLVTIVRATDIKRLERIDPIPNPPKFHGHANDPRYPSPTGWRTVFAFTIDLVIHLALTAGVVLVLHKRDLSTGALVALGVGAFCVVSFVHRVFVQRALQATVGKLLTGLRVIDENTGGRENLGSLAWAWLAGVGYFIFGVLSLLTP
ncbi:RDD family protein, partial [Kibdelosporangium lantanae]